MWKPIATKVVARIVGLAKDRPFLRSAILSALGQGKSPTLISTLVDRYCQGHGLEIGPGKHPYCGRENALYVDRYSDNKDGTPSPDIIADAAAIPLAAQSVDFLLSSHTLEHHQNTLKTLHEWVRLLKPGGVLFLILPQAERTLDRLRQRTSLVHHIRDYETLTDAYDSSHEAEVRAGWSQLPDVEAMTVQFEREWGFGMWDFARRNDNGVIHFHVWTQNEMVDVVKHIGLEVLFVTDIVPERPDSFVVISRKPS